MSDEQVEKLVAKIIGLGHASTMEHVSFTFAIEGISRVLSAPIGKAQNCFLFSTISALC